MVTDHKCESTQKLDRARSQQETSFGSKGWNCYRVPSTIIAVSPLRFAQLIGQNATTRGEVFITVRRHTAT